MDQQAVSRTSRARSCILACASPPSRAAGLLKVPTHRELALRRMASLARFAARCVSASSRCGTTLRRCCEMIFFADRPRYKIRRSRRTLASGQSRRTTAASVGLSMRAHMPFPMSVTSWRCRPMMLSASRLLRQWHFSRRLHLPGTGRSVRLAMVRNALCSRG